MKRHPVLIATLCCLALPLLGIAFSDRPLISYLEFPPLTRYVEHAPFAWPAFIALALLIVATLTPFIRRLLSASPFIPNASSLISPASLIPHPSSFPWWGWLGLAAGVAAWVLAWTRFEWFAPLQAFTFSPLWLAYIVVVNALLHRRTGHCMLVDRPRYTAGLFVVSAAFWWFFEYLNRFVQNWYYVGIGDLSRLEYLVFATLPFATVLPAVMGTYELLASVPRLSAGLTGFAPVRVGRPRVVAAIALAAAAAGLAGIGVWPDVLFPLLWLAPLIVITSLQALRGHPTIFAPLAGGDWRRVFLLALAALICGFFWEMWNYLSLAKWIYAVPYVNRFHLFEMPIVGYAGYLPFGLECAVIADGMCAWTERRPTSGTAGPTTRRGAVAVLLAAALWLPALHWFFTPALSDYRASTGIPPAARAMAARQMDLWSNPTVHAPEIQKMRRSNAEWDFMARTFFALSLANMGLRDPAGKPEYLRILDDVIADTLVQESRQGMYYFLMDYARNDRFRSRASRSLFQDGEIGLMLAARRMVEEREDYRAPLAARVDAMAAYMAESPVLSGESYPDECWMFCNTVALAAMRMHDALDGTDHSAFIRRWLETARLRLVDSRSGLLVSSYTFGGTPLDGPEGSSLWMSAHCLQIVDADFAEDQYRRARRQLGRSVLGFGYAREWPDTWPGRADVDSGPIVPLLNASPGSSGLAILGASAFGDTEYLADLLASLQFGGFPVRKDGRLRYCASNPVGDAVLLYAMVTGPLWEETRRRAAGIRREGTP